MKVHKKVFYNLRHIIPIMGIAGMTAFAASCEKPEAVTRSEQNIPNTNSRTVTPPEDTRHDMEFTFSSKSPLNVIPLDTLRYYAADSTVRTIYLVPTGSWNTCKLGNISYLCHEFLKPRIDISKKITGRGDFDFQLGEASKGLNDSIWFIKNGWTINKDVQR